MRVVSKWFITASPWQAHAHSALNIPKLFCRLAEAISAFTSTGFVQFFPVPQIQASHQGTRSDEHEAVDIRSDLAS